MRTWWIATAGLMLGSVHGAEAQRVVTPGPGPMVQPGTSYPAPTGVAPATRLQSWQAPRGPRPAPVARPATMRWGSKVDGHWWGGANAPGGWRAYRRPYRGYALPSYWIAPRFYVTDWQAYGLSRPMPGYNWVRYYDDAVLIDARGSVFDTRDGVDWDGTGVGYGQDDRVYADGGYDHRGYDDRGYDDRGYDDRGYDDRGYDDRARYDDRAPRRSNGVGGAVAGAAVGGVAGNVIAGRGNRLGGTVIGAGVGAAAGYAIDRAGNRRAPPPPPPAPYRHDYEVPVAPEGPPPVAYAPGGSSWRSSDGTTTVTTSSGGSGYYRDGYYYPASSSTTVVIQSAPVVTTTTTETFEDHVTYTRRPAVRSKTRRVWRPAPRCNCR